MSDILNYRRTWAASIVLLTTVLAAANLGIASDSHDEHHLSFGPLTSDQYYWVRAETPNAEYDSDIQEKAIKRLEICRVFQKMKHGDRMLMLSEAEEEIRMCMLKDGLRRHWTKPLVVT